MGNKNTFILRPFLFSVLILLVSVFGYSQEYHSLLSNSGWCCEKYFGTGAVYGEYAVSGTELLNDKIYVNVSNYFLQEDSLSRKVWYLNDNEDEVIYDFTLDLNDTFQIELYDTIIGSYVVTKIDTIEILAGQRKRWFFNLTDSLVVEQGTLDRSLIWIEGIGSTYGPIYPRTIPLQNEYGGSGTCLEGVYSKERIQVYQGNCGYIPGYWPDECEFITNDIEETKIEPTVAFFNELGDLEISSQEIISVVKLYDLSGRQLQIYSNKSADRKILIPNHLPIGTYFCEIYTRKNTRHCIKAIKYFYSP